MQNRKDFLDDKVFKNQAWQEMSMLLDQEMPVKRKKRIVPFFFWGTGIAAITFFVVWMNMPTKQSRPDTLEYKQETPLINTEPIATTEIENSKESVLIADRDLENEDQFILQESSNISVNKTDNQTLTTSSTKQKTGSSKQINSLKKLVEIPVALVAPKEAKKKRINIDVQNVLDEGANTAIEALHTNPILKIQSIKALNVQAINMDKSTELPEVIILPKVQLVSDFALRTGYGSNFRNQSNYHIGLDWQIGIAEKWNFVTGLQYRFFPKTEARNIDNNALQTEDIIEVGTGDSPSMSDIDPVGGNVDFSSGVTFSISPNDYIEDRHALVLPLNIQYQMNEKWSFSTGLRVAYLFQKQNFDESRNFDSLNVSTSDLNVSLDDTIEYWSNLGLQFNPIPRWGISLQYNRSWMPLSKAYSSNVSVIRSGKNNFNHFWEASVSYHF